MPDIDAQVPPPGQAYVGGNPYLGYTEGIPLSGYPRTGYPVALGELLNEGKGSVEKKRKDAGRNAKT